MVIKCYGLPDHFRNKISIISHGNYIDSYKSEITREKARAKLGLKNKQIVFLYFGLIRAYKNIDEMIEHLSD